MTDTETLRSAWLARVADAADAPALEEVRLAALGKKGEISGLMKELGRMTPEERQTRGADLNRLRDEIDAALRAKKSGLEDAALDAARDAELVLDGKPLRVTDEFFLGPSLVRGFAPNGIGPRDLISILQAIKSAGALQAEIEVM